MAMVSSARAPSPWGLAGGQGPPWGAQRCGVCGDEPTGRCVLEGFGGRPSAAGRCCCCWGGLLVRAGAARMSMSRWMSMWRNEQSCVWRTLVISLSPLSSDVVDAESEPSCRRCLADLQAQRRTYCCAIAVTARFFTGRCPVRNPAPILYSKLRRVEEVAGGWTAGARGARGSECLGEIKVPGPKRLRRHPERRAFRPPAPEAALVPSRHPPVGGADLQLVGARTHKGGPGRQGAAQWRRRGSSGGRSPT